MFSPNSPKLPKRVRALSKIIGVPNALDLLELIGTYKTLGKGASGTAYDIRRKSGSFVVKTGRITKGEQRISKYLSEKTDAVPKQYGGGAGYQIMEKLDGVPLEKCLNPSRNQKILSEIFPNVVFDKNTITKIIKRTIEAYSNIHELGIAHSDIHTGNIFVTAPDLKIKIIDFGISRQGFSYVLEEILYGSSLEEANVDYSFIDGLDVVEEFFPKSVKVIFKRELNKFWIENICNPLGIDFKSIKKQVQNNVDIIEEIYDNPESDFKKINTFLQEITDEDALKLVKKFYDSLLSALGVGNEQITAKSNIIEKFAEGGFISKPTLSLVGEANEREFIFKTKDIGLNDTNLNEIPQNSTKLRNQKQEPENIETYPQLYKKFIDRVDKFFTSTNKILSLFRKNTLKLIEIRNRIFETEKIDKEISRRERKKLEDQLKDSKKKKRRPSLNLGEDGNYLALMLGLAANPENYGGGPTEVFDDVVSEGEFAVDKSGSITEVSPAWIPFPKGTKNLTFTSGFGYQTWRGREHGGIDIAGPVGTPIITPISGIVESAGFSDDGYGYKVVVKKGNLTMLFGHLQGQPNVKVGQSVIPGTKIGGLGNTGQSTGPHLHWTIMVNGIKVNPVSWSKSNRPEISVESPEQKAEGGINFYSNIMVGEAGDEIVVPISQMDIFMRAMIDEKIKSMLPFYIAKKIEGEYGITGIGESADKKYASGGLVSAETMIKKHEALGAFVPNTGVGGTLPDFINVSEGGLFSVISNTPKDKCYDLKTILYGYMDSEGVPTIGFGTTQFGDIYGGGTPAVTMQSQISVKTAFDIMRKHVKQIDDKHRQVFPLWKYIPDRAKGGLLSYLYNRGQNVFLNTTDPLNKLLKQGNLPAMAAIIRGDTVSVGPKRRADEADAIKSGGIIKKPEPKEDKKPQPTLPPTPTQKPTSKPPLVTADCKRGRRPKNLLEAIQQGYLVGICESKKTFEAERKRIFKKASAESPSSQLNSVAYEMHNNVINFDNKFDFDRRISEENTIYFVQDTIRGEIV